MNDFETQKICSHCGISTKKYIKCSGLQCQETICKNCATFIDDIPFCVDCLADFIKNDTLLIVPKSRSLEKIRLNR